MPFAFLMLWTPGYLNEDKNKKSNVSIKSGWFAKINKWTASSFANAVYVFMLLILTKNVIAGTATFVLSVALLAIYLLWYMKHKSDFMKNINDGYALTSVGINLAIIFAVVYQLMTQTNI